MEKRNTRLILTLITAGLLLMDGVHSFRQHMQFPTDGDMTFNVVPSETTNKILEDPLALKVLLHDEQYLNPNRFFSHWANQRYCWNVPLYLQSLADPISSIYLSQAILKIIVQLCLIFLIARYVTPKAKWWSAEFLLPALLVTPFFQTFGLNSQMGIIDRSTTYVFFYSLPIIFILLFFLPVAKWLRNDAYRIRSIDIVFMFVCAFIAAFSGPLNLGVAPIVGIALFLYFLLGASGVNSFREKIQTIPSQLYAPFIFLACACIYSILINAKAGTMAEEMPTLGSRYILMMQGLAHILTVNVGLPWLMALILLNSIVVRYFFHHHSESKQLLKLIRWMLPCIAAYLLLLPLGGYRPYRELIVRSDTFMPVTLCLIWYFSWSTFFLIKTIVASWKWAYYFVMIYSLIYFSQRDKLADAGHECEKKMMHEVAESPLSIVKLSEPCPLVEWQVITDYRQSDKAGELLLRWRVTKEKKYFYYEPTSNSE